ncbi:chromo domain-containing protein [Dictyostelium discoideum AX4]|uniref:Chromo domain-containing protein n=1 Tax=Dictyostelium discoideum TaxID=44689 RepID=Q54RQ4_DICDI|nr:chromo domain-containing protein [Dictyostelium discoideum AX4]EAL65937.1 chromo domain-containing protein [Dictyostelium discoideum AX4]|eukprot:XP_639297.1 chromo domain-containing protein [Dictyostelium discoideum AX4]
MGKRDKKIIIEEPEELEEAEDVFEVEKILDKRVQHGRIQYNVRWIGFSSDYDTWEDEDNVAGCPELVKEFESSRQQEKKKSKKRKHTIINDDPTAVEISSSSSPPTTKPSSSTTAAAPASSSASVTTKTATATVTTDTYFSNNTTSTHQKTNHSVEVEENIKNEYIKFGVPYIEGVGFENGHCVEEVIGCKPFGQDNTLFFFVKWRDQEKLSWVPNEILKHKEPLQLIEFYESRLKFGYSGQPS